MFRRILVPTDFSETSDAALEYARVLAARCHGTLQLLHVVEDPALAAPIAAGSEASIGPPAFDREVLVRDAEVQFAERLCEGDRMMFGATATVVFALGRTADAILDAAVDQQVDLIVMGTHGRRGLAHVLMGSVVERVVRMAPCPVLTVRTAPPTAVGAVPRSAVA